jgi:glucose-6-phosphate isomerase
MSVVRPKPPEDPLECDAAGVFATGRIGERDLAALHGRLDAARATAIAAAARLAACTAPAAGATDTAFIDRPDRLLSAYHSARPSSELFAILAIARRLREAVDRVVVVGTAGSSTGARTLFESCCHPLHNELSRGERGGRPRLSFAAPDFDNDSARGLLDLLDGGGRASHTADLLDRWALIVTSGSAATFATAVAARLYLAALFAAVGRNREKLSELFVPITGSSGRLADLARAVGCRDTFEIPAGGGDAFAVFTAACLLPAATAGIDIVRLLEGAAAMNRRFREAPVAENPVLRFAGVSRLAEERLGATIRVVSCWSHRLEALGPWYDQLLAESLGRRGSAAPVAAVVARDPPGAGPEHRRWRRDTLTMNLVGGEPRCDRLTLPALGGLAANEDGLDDLVGRSWPEMLAAAVAGTTEAFADEQLPAVSLILPRIDEHTVGQILQMLMLATAVEGRLEGPGISGPERSPPGH